MNAIDSISKASIKLILSEPFYGHFMIGLPKEISTNTETAAVALMNRQTGILLESFAYLEPMFNIVLKKDKDVGYYYRQLEKIFTNKARMSFNDAVKQTQSGNQSGETQIQIIPIFDEGHSELNKHQFWDSFDKLSEGERKIAEYQANRMIKQSINRVRDKYTNFGNLPAGLAEKLAIILNDMQPRFNWRRMLRLFATSSNSTYIKNTIRRPSKRYGTVPGVKVKRRNRLLLAIDTSCSIQQDELLEFFSEIYYIWRQGSEIKIVECDTDIHKIYDYKGFPPEKIHGRGGTAFEAPIQYGNETYKPDALIYFTDGYASTPKVLPVYPVLWVISSNGLKEEEGVWDELPGKKLRLS